MFASVTTPRQYLERAMAIPSGYRRSQAGGNAYSFLLSEKYSGSIGLIAAERIKSQGDGLTQDAVWSFLGKEGDELGRVKEKSWRGRTSRKRENRKRHH